jgi:hypothetical protein
MGIELREDGTLEVVDEGIVEIYDDDMLHKPRAVVATKVKDEYIIYNNRKDLFFTTNEVGYEILNHCTDGTFRELLDSVLPLFEGDQSHIIKSIRNHVGLLASIGIIDVERLEQLREDSFKDPKRAKEVKS